jgi:deoxycytidine triphosphate deaminase
MKGINTVKLLKDDELVQHVTGADPIVLGLATPANWYSVDSPVQPSSIDLHIGEIFLPGTTEKDRGGASQPLSEHILKSGQTAVVVTGEEVRLPGHLAGIGFPPSHVSFKGILMTNPGHVDPGYSGHLHFTVINMGRQDYVLRRDDAIVTLLLIELSDAAHRNWLQRRAGTTSASSTQENLRRLAPDFVDVEQRATAIAEKAVQSAELRVKLWQVWAPVVGTLVAAAVGLFLTWVEPARKELQKMQTEVAELKSKVAVEELKTRLDQVERLLNEAPRPALPKDAGGQP